MLSGDTYLTCAMPVTTIMTNSTQNTAELTCTLPAMVSCSMPDTAFAEITVKDAANDIFFPININILSYNLVD